MYQYIETKCFVVLYLYKMSACVIVDMATEGKKSYMCASYETPCFNLEKNAFLSLSLSLSLTGNHYKTVYFLVKTLK